MSVNFIVYIEDFSHADMRSYPLLDQFMDMFGYSLYLIDRTKLIKPHTNNVFTSLNMALKSPKFKDCKWIYLDAKGEEYVDEYNHPKDNVVYITGSDAISPLSFEGKKLSSLNGDIIKLRSVPNRVDWRSHTVAIATACTRFTLLKK